MAAKSYMLFFSTTNSVEDAERIARYLVDQRIVACVSIVPSVTSVYRWKQEVTRDSEVLLIFKTTSAKATDLEKAIRAIHSYEVPELIGIEMKYGLPQYLNWIESSVTVREE